MQPAILLITNKDAIVSEQQVISAVSQSYKITTELPQFVENQTVTKDVSQSWQQNSHRILKKKTSQWKENPDLSFLIVNGKQGEKELFVDLGKYKSFTYNSIILFQRCVQTENSLWNKISE